MPPSRRRGAALIGSRPESCGSPKGGPAETLAQRGKSPSAGDVTKKYERHISSAVPSPQVTTSLRELVRCVSPAVKLNDIENTVSIYFGLRTADLHTSKKSRTIALARGIAMYLARKHTEMSFPEIGRFMRKNHSTVILACRRTAESMAANETVEWISAGGPRTKNINTIIADIEAQSGNTLTSTTPPDVVLGAA